MSAVYPRAPFISVVIPAFKAAPFIADAVKSVLAQNRDDVEIIVVNDGSPDTPELEQALALLQDRIHYLKKENGGVSSARNAGIEAAKGVWLAFLDADDTWKPNYLRSQLAILENDSSIDMVFPNATIVGDTPLAGREIREFSTVDEKITFLNVLRGTTTISYGLMVRRELPIEAGLFDESLRGSEDYNLWLRILRRGARVVSNPEPLYNYRRHDRSLTWDNTWMSRRILESLDKTEQTLNLNAEETAALQEHRKKVEYEIEADSAKSAILQHRTKEAIGHLKAANQLAPSTKLSIVIFTLRFFPWLLYRFLKRRDNRASVGDSAPET